MPFVVRQKKMSTSLCSLFICVFYKFALSYCSFLYLLLNKLWDTDVLNGRKAKKYTLFLFLGCGMMVGTAIAWLQRLQSIDDLGSRKYRAWRMNIFQRKTLNNRVTMVQACIKSLHRSINTFGYKVQFIHYSVAQASHSSHFS